jgi:hypothetical protein
MRRLLAGLAAVAALLVAGPTAAPAQAAPESCTGVWVVVDPGPLGGGVRTGCATDYRTGAQSLASAGFEASRSSGMICRIDGQPERCEVSTSGYWSYWQASPDGDGYGPWVYAGIGPDSTAPAAGAAEGWSFGDGSTPPSELPATLAQGGDPAQAGASPGTAAPPTPPATQAPEPAAAAGGLSGPLGVAVVAGVLLVAAGAVWLARRRRP